MFSGKTALVKGFMERVYPLGSTNEVFKCLENLSIRFGNFGLMMVLNSFSKVKKGSLCWEDDCKYYHELLVDKETIFCPQHFWPAGGARENLMEYHWQIGRVHPLGKMNSGC